MPKKQYPFYVPKSSLDNTKELRTNNNSTEANRGTEAGSGISEVFDYSSSFMQERSRTEVAERFNELYQFKGLEDVSSNLEQYSIKELMAPSNYSEDIYSFPSYLSRREGLNPKEGVSKMYDKSACPEDLPVKEEKCLGVSDREGKTVRIASIDSTSSPLTQLEDQFLRYPGGNVNSTNQYQNDNHLKEMVEEYIICNVNNSSHDIHDLVNYSNVSAESFKSSEDKRKVQLNIPKKNANDNKSNDCTVECPSTHSIPTLSSEDICIEETPCPSNDNLWVTSLMASTHFPSKWLASMMRDFIIYIFFVLCLAFVVLSNADVICYYSCYSVSQLLLKYPYKYDTSDNNIPKKDFYQIKSIEDSWDFILNGFIPNTNLIYLGNNDSLSEPNEENVLYENVVVGVPRMRQVRVKADECHIQPEFRGIFKTCYGYYSSFSEDQSAFGPKSGSAWMHSNDPNDVTYYGKISHYDSGGYSYNFTKDKNSTKVQVTSLYQSTWIDRATRALFIDFTLYSPNINFFHIVQLVMELPPSGGVIPAAHCHSLKFIKYVSFRDYLILGAELFIVLFTIYFTVIIVRELRFYGHSFWKLFWGVYEMLILMVAYVCIILWVIITIFTYDRVTHLMEKSLSEPSFYPNFNYITQLHLILYLLLDIFLFLAFIKLISFLMVFKSFSYFCCTLTECALQLISHIILVVIIILSFSILGHLLFGFQVEEFSTICWSFFTLFVMIIGTFNYEKLLAANFVMAPIFVYLFIVIVLFVFMNFFIAIIVHAYSTARCNEKLCQRIYFGEAFNMFKESFFNQNRKKISSKTNSKKHSKNMCMSPGVCLTCYSRVTDTSPFNKLRDQNSQYDLGSTSISNDFTNRRINSEDTNGQEKFNPKKTKHQIIQLKSKMDSIEKTLDNLLGKMDTILNNIFVK